MRDKRDLRKKITAIVVLITMIIGILPVQALAKTINYDEDNRGSNVTITVTDQNNNVITGATLTVTRNGDTYEVKEIGNGQYQFTKSGSSKDYSITVTANGYITKTVSMRSNANSILITLQADESLDTVNYQSFRVFYIATGQLPDDYAGAGDASDYGPSGNDTPLVVIDVDINKLRKDYSSVIKYETNTSGNQWHFIPAGANKDMEAAEAFWNAVWNCMSEDSKADFLATGFTNEEFCCYVLKKQSNGTQHADGVLSKEPPVYVIELYDQTTYFGGSVTDGDDAFKKITDVLDQYEAHIGYDVTWGSDANDDGTYSGTYVVESERRRYTLIVKQTNYSSAVPIEGSTIPYESRNSTNTYYLAQFNMQVEQGALTAYQVTYTDGVAAEQIFSDNVHTIELDENGVTNAAVPAFSGGDFTRDGYTFQGWYLEGDDSGKVYSDAEVQAMNVTGDMVFHAVWLAIPDEFTGTVEVILNGVYDAATETATGERIDISTISGENTKLYFKSVSDDIFYELTQQTTGIYTAALTNGNYYIYYSVDGGVNKIAGDNGQMLTINNSDRTRYLFFNSVQYDLAGGTVPDALPVEYYVINSAVTVSSKIPEKEGYQFKGWQDQDGNLYQPSDKLTASISQPYILTAQWERMANVNLKVIVNHSELNEGTDTSPETRDMVIDLVYRASEDEPYVEVVDYDDIVKTDWYNKPTGDKEEYTWQTTVTYNNLYENLDIDYEYSVNVFIDSYSVSNKVVEVTTKEDGSKTYNVTVTMQYNPKSFELIYKIVADSSIPDDLIPKAVDIKVTVWNANKENAWAPISSHENYSADVKFDEDAQGNHISTAARYGTGSYYGVPVYKNEESSNPYYYRVAVAGFTLADGTELTASDSGNGTLYNSDSNARGIYGKGAFYANVVVENGNDAIDGTDLAGVYGAPEDSVYVQNGQITVNVCMKSYKVTLNPNGGTLNDSAGNIVFNNQFVVPDISDYKPVRTDASVFDAWYLDENNDGVLDSNETTTVQAGTLLTGDITLIAGWKQPIKVSGTVTMAGTYEQSSNVFVNIPDDARAKTTEILLQKQDGNGYWETIQESSIALDYAQEEYYYQDRAVGVGTFEFANLPNNGTYRVKMLSPNYTATYQNEPASVNDLKNYPSYKNETDETYYIALLGENDPSIATVNAHMHFSPKSFDLLYEVDATAIGENFRPAKSEVLVTCNNGGFSTAAELWPVISQMVVANWIGTESYEGDVVTLYLNDTDYKGQGTTSVWNSFPDGATLYDYGIRVYRVDTEVYDADIAPFTIQYQAPAHYTSNGQSKLLVATLQPKQYDIIYNTNGGNSLENGTHTWSFETNIENVKPQKTGYEFVGWYDNRDLTGSPVTKIEASVAEDTTLYAKWRSVQDKMNLTVTINHIAESGGKTENYDKDLQVQLTSALKGTSNPHADVSDAFKSYAGQYWHTRGDGVDVDVFEVDEIFYNLDAAYDYSVNVFLDGYYVVNKEVTSTIDYSGVTTYNVEIELQYKPDLLTFSFDVEMKDGIDSKLWPVSAEVKVTSWYDDLDEFGWNTISQHENSTVTVKLNSNGVGTGSYPVWQWLHAPETSDGGEDGLPYYYRIEIISLKLQDGTTLLLNNATDENKDIVYSAKNYSASIEVDDKCSWQQEPDKTAETSLKGAYGVLDTVNSTSNKNIYTQVGTVKAIIDVQPYTVTLDPNEGTIPNYSEDEIVNLTEFFMPNLNEYKPERTGYTFAGWDWLVGQSQSTGSILSENLSLKAKWSINSYKVTWMNDDGTILKTEDYDYGADPYYGAEHPVKTGDAQYTYTFTGWSPIVQPVTKNTEYTAQYTQSINKYTIHWIDDSGATLDTDVNVEYGATVKYDGDTPTKAATEQYTYEFAGWINTADEKDKIDVGKSITVTGDATYQAVYTSTLRSYTVTWEDDNGTVLETDEDVPYGTTPSYEGATPTKAATEQYTYTFAGWSPTISKVTGNATYIATYTAAVNTYTVTWKNDDSTVLETDEDVEYGTTPSYDGEIPTKAATGQYTYTFAGWSPTISKVTGNATYTATYTAVVKTYTVTWKNDDGTVLKTESYNYGADPYYGATPIKAVTGQYTYIFTGWTPTVQPVTEDAEYKAQYSQSTNGYTVRWIDDSGATLETDANVEYGKTAKYNKDTPTKAATEQYTYEFVGWINTANENDKIDVDESVIVTGDATYQAVYKPTLRSYTVIWEDDNGTVLETDENVEYGTMPNYDGETPTKAATGQYTYTFTGWNPEVSTVTGNITYTATYTAEVNKYTVTWKNDDGTVLETDENVEYGTTPSYDGEIPIKAATSQYTYTFAGWSPEVKAITGDITYTATYTAVVNKYTVTWKNDDGTVLETDENVEYGTMPNYDGETPIKAATGQYTYTFVGWSPAISEVTGNATYTATYTAVVNKYTVTWKNDDGTVLKTEDYNYGVDPYYGAEHPVKTGDAQYTYIFTGWSPIVQSVTEDAEYTAQYSQSTNRYTVRWVDDSGATLETDTKVEYGAIPSYDSATPTKAATKQHTYTFAGWSPAISEVTGNATYTATYTAVVNKYTVTWKNDDGTVLETDTEVEYGTTPSYDGETPTKPATEQSTYTFAGWSPEVKAITGNTTYVATYTATVKKYTVTWKNEDGTVLETDTEVEYGITPSYNGQLPKKAISSEFSYTFIGWSPSISPVVNDVEYVARFNEETNRYTIVWLDENSDMLETDYNVYYGTIPSYDGEIPTKDATAEYSYEFSNWSPEIVKVVGAATYTAIYSEVPNNYTVTYEYENAPSNAPALPETASYTYGSGVEVADLPSVEGYAFTGWTVTTPNEIAIVDGKFTMPASDVVLTGKWVQKKENYQYTIEYYYQGENGEYIFVSDNTVVDTAPYLSVINSYPDKCIDGYELGTVQTLPLMIGYDEQKNIIKVFYVKENSSSTSDHSTITIQVENGSAVAEVTPPLEQKAMNLRDNSSGSALRFSFARNSSSGSSLFYSLANDASSESALQYQQQSTTPSMLTFRLRASNFVSQIVDVLNGSDVKITFTPYENHILDTVEVSDNVEPKLIQNSYSFASVANDKRIKVAFALDLIGGGTDGESPDGVPDKYQKKFTFNVVNGKWNDGTETEKVVYVTLMKDGKWDASGSGMLTIPAVGNMPDEGFMAGAWDKEIYTAVNGAGEVEYTYTYVKDNSSEPVPPNPQPPSGGNDDDYDYDSNESDNSSGKDDDVIVAIPEDLNGKEHFAYVFGYPDGTVQPQDNITRAEVAAIFYRLLDENVRARYFTTVNGFGDVEAGTWYNNVVSTMAAMGIVGGYPDGNFHPNDNITRAEFAAIAARFDNSGNAFGVSFHDILGHWAESDIRIAAHNGWIVGYEDGTFRPDRQITRAEAMALINRVLWRMPETPEDLLPGMIIWPDNMDTNAWYYMAVQEATNSHAYEYKDAAESSGKTYLNERWTALKNETK